MAGAGNFWRMLCTGVVYTEPKMYQTKTTRYIQWRMGRPNHKTLGIDYCDINCWFSCPDAFTVGSTVIKGDIVEVEGNPSFYFNPRNLKHRVQVHAWAVKKVGHEHVDQQKKKFLERVHDNQEKLAQIRETEDNFIPGE